MVRTMVSNVSKSHDCDAISMRVLKRLWGEHPPCPKKLTSVRRNLFGLCDGKEKALEQAFEKEFTAKVKKASQDWNFDFVNEVPLPGRYLWQRVASRDLPAWYSAMSRPTLKEVRNRRSSDDQSSESETEFKELKESSEPLPPPSCKKPRLVQTSMKDFTRVQKRRSSRRLRLKQVQVYSYRLRNHHLSLHGRGVITTC